MGMTRSQIRAKIRTHTNTSSANTGGYSDDTVNGMINDAILEIATVTNASVSSTVDSGSFTTVASTRLYTYPSSALKLYQVLYDGKPLKFKEVTTLPTVDGNGWWGTYSEPQNYYLERSAGSLKVGLYPIPIEAKSGSTFFVVKPASLGADNDVPDLPDFLHPAIESYVSREIWLDRENPDMAAHWGTRYADRIQLYLSNGHEDETRQELLSEEPGV